jgi:hypothetical protein
VARKLTLDILAHSADDGRKHIEGVILGAVDQACPSTGPAPKR